MNIFDWAKVIFNNRDMTWWVKFSACAAAALTVLILIVAGIGSCAVNLSRQKAVAAVAATKSRTTNTTTTTKPLLTPAEAFEVSAADALPVYNGSSLMAESDGYIYYAHPDGGTYSEPVTGGNAERLMDSNSPFCIMSGDIFFLGIPKDDERAKSKKFTSLLTLPLSRNVTEAETVYPGNVFDFAAAGGRIFYYTKENDITFPNSLCSIRPGDREPKKIYAGGYIPFSDGSRVYWYGGRGVFSIMPSGSGKKALTDDVRVKKALAAGDWIYFLTQDGELRRVGNQGGTSEILARGCGDFATDGAYLYTIGPNADREGKAVNAELIIRFNMDGSARKILLEADVHQLTGAAKGWVYFHEKINGRNKLRRVQWDGSGLEDVNPDTAVSESVVEPVVSE